MIKMREGFRAQRLFRLPEETLRRAHILPIVQDIYVTDIGHYPESQHHWVSRPRGHAHHILIYCVAGTGWVQGPDRQRMPVPQDHVVVIPAGQPHQYGASEQSPWNIYWVHFNGRRSGAFIKLLRGSGDDPVLAVAPGEILADAFEDTYRGLADGLTDTGLLLVSTGLARLLSLVHASRRAAGRKARHTEARVSKSMQWMRDHLDQPVQLSDLARAAGLSVPHYCALFKRQSGGSPMRCLAQFRMHRACVLLDQTERSIAEVAGAVGYESPFHFSRNFKAHMGLSPLRYRALAKG